MKFWQVLILAVVQGVTEFLPISSSGHLVIVSALTGVKDDVVDVNIVLHVGTLLSIIVFFWRRIWRLIGEDRRVVPLLIVGTIPAAIVGVLLKKVFPGVLESPLLTGYMLLITGVMLLWATRGERGSGDYRQLTWGESILIGLSQALAILPGISRSGATISTGIRLGLSPASASTYSFLLAIPAIGGAGLLQVIDLIRGAESASGEALKTPLAYLGLGMGISFLVGLASLWWLSQLLEKGRLRWFAGWCIPVGVCVILWQLMT